MAGRFWQCVPQFKCTVWQIRVTNSHNPSTKLMVLFIRSFFLTEKQISSFLMVCRVATFLLCRKLLTHVKGFPVNLTVNAMLPSIHCLCFADQIQVKKVSTGAPVTDVSHLVRRKVRKQKLVYAAININFIIIYCILWQQCKVIAPNQSQKNNQSIAPAIRYNLHVQRYCVM